MIGRMRFGVARHTDARGMATTHMLFNLVAVALFVVSVLLRLDDGALRGGRFATAFALSLVAIALLGVSGWLGGELSYRKHLGMVPDDAVLARAEQAHHGRWPLRALARRPRLTRLLASLEVSAGFGLALWTNADPEDR